MYKQHASYEAPSQLDANGWSPLHHAIDASSYSWRGLEAAKGLVHITEVDVINSPTVGNQPKGYTCLHFACDGSDKSFGRPDIARSLIAKKADLEARDPKGNTPFLLASGTGITQTIKTLMDARADVTAENYRHQGATQKAMKSSSDVKRALNDAEVPPAKRWAASGRTRTGVSESRQTRYARNDTWHQYGGGWHQSDGWRK